MPEKLTSEQLTELALRARTDRDALDELIAHEVEYVTWWVRRHVNYYYINDFEDISQELLFAIANSIPSFNGESSFARWCGVLMRNRLADWFRRTRCRTYGSEDFYDNMEPYGGTCEFESTLEKEDPFNELLEMVAPETRHYLKLLYVEDLTLHEVLELQNVYTRYDGLRSNIRRGKGFIKYELERRAEKTS